MEKQKEMGVSTVQVQAPEKNKKNGYYLTRSCSFVNDFRKIFFEKNEITPFTRAEIGNMRIFCEKEYTETIQSEATAKLFDVLRIVSYRHGQSFDLRIGDYMRMRDISPNKREREQFNESLQALKKCQFGYARDGKASGRFTILKDFTVTNGRAYIEFSREFFNMLSEKNGYSVYLPSELLQTNTHKNPNAYLICVKLAEIYQKRQTIRVGTLLKQIKSLLPLERVSKYRYKQHVINHFIRDLNSLECIKWEWVNGDGTQCNPSRYYDFLEATLKFEFLNYPVQLKKDTETERGENE